MPTISEASTPSRSVMMKAWSMRFGTDPATRNSTHAQISVYCGPEWSSIDSESADAHLLRQLNENKDVRRSGAPGRIRTSDPLVRSQMLYPAELRAHTVLRKTQPCQDSVECVCAPTKPAAIVPAAKQPGAGCGTGGVVDSCTRSVMSQPGAAQQLVNHRFGKAGCCRIQPARCVPLQ